MRKKFICQVIILSGILTACAGNTGKSRGIDESKVSVESSITSVESKESREATDLKVVKKNVTASQEETTVPESAKETFAAPETATETDKAKEESTKPVEETSKKEENSKKSADSNQTKEIGLDSGWEYASFSKINSGKAVLYKAGQNGNGITIAVNAGHGTKGGSSQKTLCHPDGSAKVTSGTTKAGATTAIAVSEGMTFSDGTPESTATFEMAKVLKDELLSRGYNVLMIRDGNDVQLDNIARTVIANNNSSAHIALHWDSTSSNKGAFYMGVPDVASYKSMEPVASNWKKHEALGKSLINGLSQNGTKIFSKGRMEMDLTQTSYSTIPSIDIELGDKKSDHGKDTLKNLSKGIADGIDSYFGR